MRLFWSPCIGEMGPNPRDEKLVRGAEGTRSVITGMLTQGSPLVWRIHAAGASKDLNTVSSRLDLRSVLHGFCLCYSLTGIITISVILK